MPPASLSEPHRVETYNGLEIASDPIGRADEGDFVVGVGPAGKILSRLTIRRRVGCALDLGTGPGLQALLAAAHCERVVGVDINPRALSFAESNARANGIENVEWRLGSWFEPVDGERFELIVANPPYVISPDADLIYRDSGEGDALVHRLLAEIPAHLEEGGFAHMLLNWLPRGKSWRAPLDEALVGSGCDAVLLKYGEQTPEEYARGWNHLLAQRDHAAFERAVARWLSYYREHDIGSIAFGLVVLRRRTEGRNWARAFAVPAAPTDGAGEHVERLFTGWDRVRAGSAVDGRVRLAPGARIVHRLDLSDGGERITFEVRPHAGFAVRVREEVAQALRGVGPLAPDELRRLTGLGMLLTPEHASRKITRA